MATTRTRPAARPDPGEAAPGRLRRWRWPLVVAAAVLGVAGLSRSLGRGPEIPPRSVHDAAFTRRADAACARALPALRRDRPVVREDTGTGADLAGRVERAAAGLEGLAGRLRALPVAAADRPRVDRWLDDWDAYAAAGRRYARALRTGDQAAVGRAGPRGEHLARRIYLFSRANGMDRCTL